MLKYLIVQLDDVSTSFCHYSHDRTLTQLMPLETLNKAILWSMKENLTIQFLYPDYELPADYKDAIAATYHADIVSSTCEDETLRKTADVVVFDSLASIGYYMFNPEQSYVIRISIDDFCDHVAVISSILARLNRLNIVFTDVLSLSAEKESHYETSLNALARSVLDRYKAGHNIQINLLTDRILLEKMNNCNAGVESIALCPDGNFYVCPAFYFDGGENIGNINSDLQIKNPQLYNRDHAPICRKCDAYHCRRCVWLNKKSTLEINTPSHEQCVMAHIERNNSRNLLQNLCELNPDFSNRKIKKIYYLDPFEKLTTK